MAIRFVLNGSPVEVEDAPAHVTLLQWLRSSGFHGAKEGCAEGECGACAVALWTSAPGESGSHYEPVNSCLLPLAALAGREVVTVEGVAPAPSELHPVQEAMVALGGSQCGYCTPGFVVSLFCEYYRAGREGFDPESISGNLCRCTGYRPIADAARGMPSPSPKDPRLVQLGRRAADPEPCRDTKARYLRPASLPEAWEMWEASPEARLIAGGTDLLVYANQRFERWPKLLSVEALQELQELSLTNEELVLGAAVPLSRIEHFLRRERAALGALEQLLPLFSSRLIRNRATLGGNLATASPIGDSAPALLALDARVELSSRAGSRMLPLRELFLGYRRAALAPGELIRAVRVPRPFPDFQRFYKVSKRLLDDISTVAAAFTLSLDEAGKVTRFGVGLGGIAATPLAAPALSELALGKEWNEHTLAALLQAASGLGTPQTDFRGSAPYRRAMLGQLLRKFYYESASRSEAAE
ncbi:MAG: 2Fe-2S iron-sulfur cluster binding domain-containing protein [Myxococcales bacterium]|nr:MAG: 2Fe-2S iron-sulfur cluster binding domain-containing protein [Myxococcales bacterium]